MYYFLFKIAETPFVDEIINNSMDIWNKCLDHPFIKELENGTLPEEKFKLYMIQDSMYLRYYARAYGGAIMKSKTMKDIQMFYSLLSFVTDGESVTRINYLKKFNMSDDDIEFVERLPENKAYTDFLLSTAENSDVPEILMAVLPCTLTYSFLFRKMVERTPKFVNNKYWDVVEMYASDGLVDICNLVNKFTEEKCKDLSKDRKKKLNDIFRAASIHELNFWEMSYKDY